MTDNLCEYKDKIKKVSSNAKNASLVNDKYPFLKSFDKDNYRKEHCEPLIKSMPDSSLAKNKVSQIISIAGDDNFFVGKLKTPLAINMSQGVIENGGICLDRNSGVPYIAGSAIKGCVRKYVINLAKENGDTNARKEIIKKAAIIFGYSETDLKKGGDFSYAIGDETQANALFEELKDEFGKDEFGKSYESYAGSIVFLPAFSQGAILGKDIVNCHHTEYYKKDSKDKPASKGASDNETPVPILFLVVKEGEFVFGVKALRNKNIENIACAKEWLRRALENGIGAKTAAGYGAFCDFEKSTHAYREKRKQKEAQDIEEKKRQLEKEEAAKAKELERIKKAKEAERKASMSPEDYAAENMAKTLGDGQLKEFLNKSEQDKLIVVKAAALAPAKWSDYCKNLSSNEKKKKKKENNIKAIRGFAEKHNIDLVKNII